MINSKTKYIMLGCSIIVLLFLVLVSFSNNSKNNFQNFLDNDYDKEQLADISCMITSGPINVYGEDGAYSSVSSCTDVKKEGNCYVKKNTVDTSYCGPDDSADCYLYWKYYVSCSGTSITCSPGYYIPSGSSQCNQSCPAGYKCPGGTYSINSSSSSFEKCQGTTYSTGGSSQCNTCSGTLVVNNGLNVGCNIQNNDKIICSPGYYIS